MTSNTPDITIIIVNYNVKEYLASCLNSIRKAKQDLELEIFVVDNASTDGSESYIPTHFPEVTYLYNQENVGFGKANNQAIEKATGKYTLIINPDTLISEDTLKVMFDIMEVNPEFGASGCKMLNADGSFAPESRRSVPNIKAAASKVLGLNNLFPKNKVFGAYYMSWLNENDASTIPVLSGAFMFFRTEVLKELEGFDERFFMYGEDIDLCYRTTQAGYKIYYEPATSIIHYKGESTKKDDIRYIKLFNKALYQFFEKHYTSRYSLLFRSLIFMAIVIRGITSFVATKLKRGKFLLLDLLLLNLSLIAAFFIRFSFTDVLVERLESLESLEFLWVNVLLTGLYIILSIGFNASKNYYLSISDSLRTIFLSYIGVTVITFFARELAFSRVVLALGLIITAAIFTGVRLIRINKSKHLSTNTGKFKKTRIIIVGEGESSLELMKKISSRPDWEYEVLGTVSISIKENMDAHHLGTVNQLSDLIKSMSVDHIYFMLDKVSYKEMFSYISKLRGYDVIFKIIPESMDFIVGKSNVEYIESIPLIEVNLPYQSFLNQFLKRSLDLVIAIPSAILLWPISIPQRLSKSGKLIDDNLVIKTPVEKNRLRNLSSLINSVITGKLSLVGAPILSKRATEYSYKKGLTGAVQLNSDRINSIEDQEKFELNYLQNYSIWMDIDILVKTLIADKVVSRWLAKGAKELD